MNCEYGPNRALSWVLTPVWDAPAIKNDFHSLRVTKPHLCWCRYSNCSHAWQKEDERGCCWCGWCWYTKRFYMNWLLMDVGFCVWTLLSCTSLFPLPTGLSPGSLRQVACCSMRFWRSYANKQRIQDYSYPNSWCLWHSRDWFLLTKLCMGRRMFL